jgi:UDP-glucose 4-epimerase
MSVMQVIDTAREVTGHPIPIQVSARRPGDPAQLVAGAEKAKSTLGWKPKYGELQTIVQHAWNWHKAHPNGYSR